MTTHEEALEILGPPGIRAYTTPPSRKGSFIAQYGSTLVGQGLTLGLGIVTGVLSARLLGPGGRGELAAITIWPMAIVALVSLGLNQAVAFNVGRRKFTLSEVASAAITIGAIQSALAVLVGLVVTHHTLVTYSPAIRGLGVIFVLVTPLLMLGGYPANLFQGLQDMLRFNLIRVAAPVTFAIGLILVYVSHSASVVSVMYAQVIGYIVALLLGLAMTWLSLKPKFTFRRQVMLDLISFGSRTQATNLANYFNQRIDQLALSLFIPPKELGFYVVAVTLSASVTVFPQAAAIVTFSRGASQSQADAKATIGASFRASLLWLIVCCGMLYISTPFLIHHVFGSAFEGSILACRILLPGTLMVGLNQVLYNGASALGRPGLPSCAEGISMAVTAIGLYLLLPRYGYIGAAVVSSLAYTISFVVMLILARKSLGIKLRSLLLTEQGVRP